MGFRVKSNNALLLATPSLRFFATMAGRLFFGDRDPYRLCLLLQECVERFGHWKRGFCVVTNHRHLAVQVADMPRSKIMQNVSFRCTRWITRRHRRVFDQMLWFNPSDNQGVRFLIDEVRATRDWEDQEES